MRTNVIVLLAALLAAPGAFGQAYAPPPPAVPPTYPSVPPTYPSAQSTYSNVLPTNPAAQPVYTPPSSSLSNSPNELTVGGWLAGVGFYYLQPKWGSNPAYSTLNTTTNNLTTTEQSAQQDFTMNGQFVPLVYLGYMTDAGIGFRTRWWQMHGSSSTSLSQPAQANPPASTVFSDYPLGIGFASQASADSSNVMNFDSNLTMDVVDAEIIWDVRGGGWSMLFGTGLRFAHLNQDYNASWLSIPTDPTQDTVLNTLLSGHNFDGIGPVVSLEGRYAMGSSGFAILANARGALLFGSGTQSVLLDTMENDSTGALVSESILTRSQSTCGVLPMAELELGVEWGQKIGFAQFSLQAMMVGQAWFYAGNAANQDGASSSLTGDSLSNQDPMGLIGFRLMASMSY